jgi:zinc transport system substrate-binding protein
MDIYNSLTLQYIILFSCKNSIINRKIDPLIYLGMKMRNFFLVVTSLTATLFFTSCGTNENRSIDILVSTPPYIYFVNELTEGELTVASIVPKGASPHMYEPSPGQVKKAYTASLWIRAEEGFEKKIGQALQEQKPTLEVLNLAQKLHLPHLHGGKPCSCSHHHHEEKDPHFWLSLKLAKKQATLIADAIIRAFPDRKKQIDKTLPALLDKFSTADETIQKKLKPHEGKSILISHPAFGYFCHDYQIKQVSIEHEGKDPLPKQISAILESMQSSKIQTVFTQSQYNNKGAKVIAKKLNLETHEIDPYSSDYLNNILQIAHFIANP